MKGPEKPCDASGTSRNSGLLLFFTALLLIMAAYEYTRQAKYVGSEGWEIRALLIIAAAALGTTAAFYLVKRSGRINRQLGYYLDELQRTKDALQTREEMYRSLVESTGDSIYVVDRDTRYLFINRKHRERMGLTAGNYQGREYGSFHFPDEAAAFREQVDAVIRTGESGKYEHKSQRDNRYFLRTCSPVRDVEGRIFAVNVVSTDVTELKTMEESLRALSFTDTLTGLRNRRGLYALADQQMKLAGRMQKRLYVLYVDMDNLKEINDRLGHQKGDDAIIMTAKILRETFRESDTIARIGGDEFVVTILSEERDSADAIRGRLQKNIDRHNAKTYVDYTLSLSTGIAYYEPAHPLSLDALIVEADRLMYIHKRSKKER